MINLSYNIHIFGRLQTFNSMNQVQKILRIFQKIYEIILAVALITQRFHMSYKSEWLRILASLNASIKLYIKNPNNKNSEPLQKSIDNFTAFVTGHLPLLRRNTYSMAVIESFDLNLSNQTGSDISLYEIQNFNDILETAILTIKEDSSMNIEIGSITGGNQQLGNDNTQNNNDINIDLKTLINQIEKSDDEEAKGKLRDLLNNSTVASIIGASIPALMQLIQNI